MQMMIMFDIDADVIDVPQRILENREVYKRQFWKWLSNTSIRHSYWVTFEDGTKGLRFRSDAFVEWLNKKVLKQTDQKAVIIHSHVRTEDWVHLPSIFF